MSIENDVPAETTARFRAAREAKAAALAAAHAQAEAERVAETERGRADGWRWAAEVAPSEDAVDALLRWRDTFATVDPRVRERDLAARAAEAIGARYNSGPYRQGFVAGAKHLLDVVSRELE